MKIKDKEAKFKYKRAIFLSPKLLLPILLETTLNFIIGLQPSSKWYPNGLHFTSKVVSNWSPMETFSGLPISSQPWVSDNDDADVQTTTGILLMLRQLLVYFLGHFKKSC